MSATFTPTSWLEKIAKTIQMIHASPAYRLYMKRKHRREALDAYRLEGGGRQLRPLLNVPDPSCIDCGIEIMSRARKTRLCIPCFGQHVVALYRSGLTIKAIAKRFKVCEATIFKRLKEAQAKSRPAKTLSRAKETKRPGAQGLAAAAMLEAQEKVALRTARSLVAAL